MQQLSAPVHAQIFGKAPAPPLTELVELSKNHLARHELWGKTVDTSPPVVFDLPKLQGETLDEHFHRLGMDAAEPYLSLAKDYARAILPDRPRRWVRRSGWTKYYPDGRTETVDAPHESVLTFDTEVMWKESPFAVMACAPE